MPPVFIEKARTRISGNDYQYDRLNWWLYHVFIVFSFIKFLFIISYIHNILFWCSLEIIFAVYIETTDLHACNSQHIAFPYFKFSFPRVLGIAQYWRKSAVFPFCKTIFPGSVSVISPSEILQIEPGNFTASEKSCKLAVWFAETRDGRQTDKVNAAVQRRRSRRSGERLYCAKTTSR